MKLTGGDETSLVEFGFTSLHGVGGRVGHGFLCSGGSTSRGTETAKLKA